jgi:anti-anti-sigma regulatory factor
MLDFSSLSDPAARVYNVDLNQTDPVRLAGRLYKANPEQRPQLLIDCQRLECLRTRGVSHLASQLLLTRQAGADVLLYNVDSVLCRALRLLQLHLVFRVVPAPTA